MQKITTFLWFHNQADEAIRHYASIFKNSKVVSISRYGDTGPGPKGAVMVVKFQLDGQEFTALNGGPAFTFNEAVSFQIYCETQEELDYYWEKLTPGGDASAQQCGWLKDKYGLSWQVVPTALAEMISDPDTAKSGRVMEALLQMKKLEIERLKRAYEGRGGT